MFTDEKIVGFVVFLRLKQIKITISWEFEKSLIGSRKRFNITVNNN